MATQTSQEPPIIEDDRTGNHVETLKRAILDNLYYIVARVPERATPHDYFTAVAYTVRDRIIAGWMKTLESYNRHDVRVVCYLSAEFLMGPYLANNLLNMGLDAPFRQAMTELGLDVGHVIEQESEPGLGNGGLGRLAACYLDSMATLGVPAIGYGIRYEFGIFQQAIQDGWQVELTDYWLRNGNPWEIRRSLNGVEVHYGGHTESYSDEHGHFKVRWIPHATVLGIPSTHPFPVMPRATSTISDCGDRRRRSLSTSRSSTAA